MFDLSVLCTSDFVKSGVDWEMFLFCRRWWVRWFVVMVLVDIDDWTLLVAIYDWMVCCALDAGRMWDWSYFFLFVYWVPLDWIYCSNRDADIEYLILDLLLVCFYIVRGFAFWCHLELWKHVYMIQCLLSNLISRKCAYYWEYIVFYARWISIWGKK